MLLRSDELLLPKHQGELERAFGGSRIVLSTLSMLSNPHNGAVEFICSDPSREASGR